MDQIHIDRLLNAAKALEESPLPAAFTMQKYGLTQTDGKNRGLELTCGTPACVLGHYAARRDLQQEFTFVSEETAVRNGDGKYMDWNSSSILNHFGITRYQADDLFGPRGCGGAVSTEEAALFIKGFVAQQSRL